MFVLFLLWLLGDYDNAVLANVNQRYSVSNSLKKKKELKLLQHLTLTHCMHIYISLQSERTIIL